MLEMFLLLLLIYTYHFCETILIHWLHMSLVRAKAHHQLSVRALHVMKKKENPISGLPTSPFILDQTLPCCTWTSVAGGHVTST